MKILNKLFNKESGNEGETTAIRVHNTMKNKCQQEFENKVKEIKEIEGERLWYRIIRSGETLVLKGLPITLCNDVICYSGNWNLIQDRECAPTENERNGWTTVVMSNESWEEVKKILGTTEENETDVNGNYINRKA